MGRVSFESGVIEISSWTLDCCSTVAVVSCEIANCKGLAGVYIASCLVLLTARARRLCSLKLASTFPMRHPQQPGVLVKLHYVTNRSHLSVFCNVPWAARSGQAAAWSNSWPTSQLDGQ
jgi:hypothetical protein